MIVLLLPLILGLSLFVAVILAGRWFANANPAKLAATARSGGSLAMILVGLLLLLRGQPTLGLGLAAAGLGRLRGNAAPFGGGGFGGQGAGWGGRAGRQGRRAGQSSAVRTAMLEATLDHDTGEIDAVVLAGRFEGRRFSALPKPALLGLWVDCAADGDSRLLVEAYLDRRHPEWRDDVEGDRDAGAGGAGRARPADRSGPMTQEEAYEILGLEPGAGEAAIRASHRRLMKQMHPDQGGSTFLAARINEAKDVLLRRRR